MKHLIATMENDEITELVKQAIQKGKSSAPDQDINRTHAEAWLRGWCDDRCTPSFTEAVVIFLHNHIVS